MSVDLYNPQGRQTKDDRQQRGVKSLGESGGSRPKSLGNLCLSVMGYEKEKTEKERVQCEQNNYREEIKTK